MKKAIVIFIFFASAILLQGVTFQKYYHANFGIIERIVLVFDNKPTKVIEQNNKEILITISNCRKEANIEEKQVPDNLVLEYFRFMKKANDVIVIISLDTNYVFDKLEYFDEEAKVYKIVLDVFNTKDPQTPEEHMSFADYYGALGKKDKAEFHSSQALEIEKEMLEKEMAEEEIETIPQVEEEIAIEEEAVIEDSLPEIELQVIDSISETFLEESIFTETDTIIESIIPESTFVESIVSATDTTEIQDTTLIVQPEESDTLGVGLSDEESRENVFLKLLLKVLSALFLIFFIKTIIKFARIGRRKKSEEELELEEEEEKDYRSYEGFGSEEFKKKMIFKLIDKDWEPEEIAKELNLTLEEVIRLQSGKKKVIEEDEKSEEDEKRDKEEVDNNDEVSDEDEVNEEEKASDENEKIEENKKNDEDDE
ncbi:MAG: hypothetical protein HQ534_09530 [Armatimonadetes bacterium]|nr:hypothetical protein [Armatimonadota bacterium]